MAEQEPVLNDAQSQDVSVHVQDYTRFIKLLKWTAIVSLIIGFVVLLILK